MLIWNERHLRAVLLQGTRKFVTIEVDSLAGVPVQVAIGSSQNMYVACSSMPTRSSGNAEFDRVMVVKGDEPSVLAVLNAEGRAAILEFQETHCDRIVNKSIAVINGHVFFMHAMGFRKKPKNLDTLLNAVAELTKAISLQATISQRLLDNIETERSQKLRKRNLDALLTHFPESKEAAIAAEIELAPPDEKNKGGLSLSAHNDEMGSLSVAAEEGELALAEPEEA